MEIITLKCSGVMMPMYQSEALWLRFEASYPFALKVATGKVNAVSGEAWRTGLHRTPQDYVVLPDQPWLDGYCVGRGAIRQFVAMPLGDGYGAEEQITGKAEFGGIQLRAHPLSAQVFFEEGIRNELPDSLKDILKHLSVGPSRSSRTTAVAPGRSWKPVNARRHRLPICRSGRAGE